MNLTPSDWPSLVALAAVAAIGYLVGHFTRRPLSDRQEERIDAARAAAAELEKLSSAIHKRLAEYGVSVRQLWSQVVRLISAGRSEPGASPAVAQPTVDEILGLTETLAEEVQAAQARIRHTAERLASAGRRQTPRNRSDERALDEVLDSLFAMQERYRIAFSVAQVRLDAPRSAANLSGKPGGDARADELAAQLEALVRETDSVCRRSNNEITIALTETDLDSACVFCERLRRVVGERLGLSISIGIASAIEGESRAELLARAKVALDDAQAGGGHRIHKHDGDLAAPYAAQALTATAV